MPVDFLKILGSIDRRFQHYLPADPGAEQETL